MLRGHKQSSPAEGCVGGTLSGGGVLVFYCCRATYPKPRHLNPHLSPPSFLGRSPSAVQPSPLDQGLSQATVKVTAAATTVSRLDWGKNPLPRLLAGFITLRVVDQRLLSCPCPLGLSSGQLPTWQRLRESKQHAEPGSEDGGVTARDTQSSRELTVWEETGAGGEQPCRQP